MGFTLNHAGLIEILNSEGTAQVMHDAAAKVMANALQQQPDADMVVDDYTTDRRASSVTIREPQARLWQAQDGILTRAAAAAGLEVTERDA